MAQEAVPDGGVSFGTIDAATVRVFAVRHVAQETVRGRYRQRVLGLPNAGHGTGVVVDRRGVIVTAKHVVEGARHVAVRLPGGGPVLPTRVVYLDPDLDFAILLVVAPRPLTAIELSETNAGLAVRQTVDAIGYPFDANRSQPQSARGIISGVLDDGHLQLDMSLNPGNSGGPLLDADEHLVGIIVARADPTQGAQGIGIAVPIEPVRQAYEQVLRRGQLSRAFRALRADLEPAARGAEVVDAIVRLGGADLLREAADFVESPEASQRIDSLRAMAHRARDPDLLALLAAYFWDAAQVMVERAGGVATPAQMHPGPAQQLADELWRQAIDTATRARDADPSVVQRSPFVGYLAGSNRWQPASTTTPVASDGAAAAPPHSWQPGNGRRSGQQGWSPWLLAGFNLFGGSEGAGPGYGVRLGALFPLGSGGPRSGFKFRMLAGVSADIGTWGNTLTYFAGTDIGFGIRAGGERVGFAMFALWSQGIVGSPTECYYDCYSTESYTPGGGHFGASLRLRRFHIGFSVRILGADIFNPGQGLVWSMSIPQVSWTF